jgi:hypothetical protein
MTEVVIGWLVVMAPLWVMGQMTPCSAKIDGKKACKPVEARIADESLQLMMDRA